MFALSHPSSSHDLALHSDVIVQLSRRCFSVGRHPSHGHSALYCVTEKLLHKALALSLIRAFKVPALAALFSTLAWVKEYPYPCLHRSR